MSRAKKLLVRVVQKLNERKKSVTLFSLAIFIFFFTFFNYYPLEEENKETKETTSSLPSTDLFVGEPIQDTHPDPECPELSYEPLREYEPPEPKKITPEIDERGNPIWDSDLLETLNFLSHPIPEAKVTTRDSQLPGAPRPYRNGTHQGLDYYSGFCGVQVSFGDPVYAAAEGTIYRIDHDYHEPGTSERQEILAIAHSEQDTPEDILDKLRGRQVWVEHQNGIISRYAHLHEVKENLEVGDQVEAGDLIGTVGNSGTSDGARGNTRNPHLHFEIWVGDYYLGQGLTPNEVRKIWSNVLE